MAKKHPGAIDYYENIGGVETLVSTIDVNNVPEDMRFHKDNKGKVLPVVKTVAIKDDNGNIKEIIEYGPGGVLLQSTMAAPRPPKPRSAPPAPKPKPVKSKQ
jgi:hypothetical protein